MLESAPSSPGPTVGGGSDVVRKHTSASTWPALTLIDEAKSTCTEKERLFAFSKDGLELTFGMFAAAMVPRPTTVEVGRFPEVVRTSTRTSVGTAPLHTARKRSAPVSPPLAPTVKVWPIPTIVVGFDFGVDPLPDGTKVRSTIGDCVRVGDAGPPPHDKAVVTSRTTEPSLTFDIGALKSSASQSTPIVGARVTGRVLSCAARGRAA